MTDFDIDEHVYDGSGAAEWDMVLPGPHGAEYVVSQTKGKRRVFLREPEMDLPFVQVYPEFRVAAEWPDPPEQYDVRIVEGSIKVNTDE